MKNAIEIGLYDFYFLVGPYNPHIFEAIYLFHLTGNYLYIYL